MSSGEVKVAMIIASVFIALFTSVSVGIGYSNYLNTKKVEACISADKIWAEDACVNNINELRYVDND